LEDLGGVREKQARQGKLKQMKGIGCLDFIQNLICHLQAMQISS